MGDGVGFEEELVAGRERSRPGLGRNDVQSEDVFREGHVGDGARGYGVSDGGAAERNRGGLGEELGYLVAERALGMEVEEGGERGVGVGAAPRLDCLGAHRKSRLPAKPKIEPPQQFSGRASVPVLCLRPDNAVLLPLNYTCFSLIGAPHFHRSPHSCVVLDPHTVKQVEVLAHPLCICPIARRYRSMAPPAPGVRATLNR